ncbi:MAG: DNA polymerase I [Rhodocyclaceae bacterium]|nr:DNA polymerase I [Rhodocyclaceae bacterium]
MPTLLLVDGSSYLYRAFHALPDLRNQAGDPTGALYGMIAMLRRLSSEIPAEHRACIFDASGPTFRDTLFAEYKAHRPPMPEDLARQIEPIHAVVRALGWPLLMESGVEADDVIGTLARDAAANGMQVVISTGDKDLAQLVTPQVTLVNTMSNERLDVAGVEAKFGVPPERITDYLALVGDTADNIPGVQKVGPKTAAKWLQTYGNLDGVIAHAAEVKGVAGENLRAHLHFLPLGRALATVKTDVALPLTLADLQALPEKEDVLRNIFRHNGFKTWLKALEQPGSTTVNSTGHVDVESAPMPALLPDDGAHRAHYETILDEATLSRWLEKISQAERVALDTETTSLDEQQARLVGISFAIAPGEAAYLPLAHTGPDVPNQLPFDATLARLKPWLENPTPIKVMQHAKYDQHVFANHGIRLAGVVDDTLLMAYVLEAGQVSAGSLELGALARRHLGMTTIPYEAICGKGANQISFDQVAVADATAYAAEDADITLRIADRLRPQLAAEPGLEHIYRDLELPVEQVLFTMEQNGVLIDNQQLADQSHALGERMLTLESETHTLAGQSFNLNSPKQLAEILFTQQGLPVKKKTASGTPSTDEEVLTELALDFPLPRLLLEYRSIAKLKNTYCDKLPQRINPATGRVHTHYSQTTAVTGRLASSDPNLQNIPVRTGEGRRIREAFIAPTDHCIISADYSQIELRIMAHLSADRGLLDAFAHGEDIHRATAAEVFGVMPLEVSDDQRRAAKAINFGLIYGMSAFGLARQLGIERSAAQTYIDRYFDRYPGVARYMEETRQSAHHHGYVETVFGRRLWLPDLKAGQQGRRQGAERAAINAPMQGTAADLIKMAMIAVQHWIEKQGLKTRLIMQVHDELVLDAPNNECEQVRSALGPLMTQVAKLKVPLVVDIGIGQNWEEAH